MKTICGTAGFADSDAARLEKTASSIVARLSVASTGSSSTAFRMSEGTSAIVASISPGIAESALTMFVSRFATELTASGDNLSSIVVRCVGTSSNDACSWIGISSIVSPIERSTAGNSESSSCGSSTRFDSTSPGTNARTLITCGGMNFNWASASGDSLTS